MIKHYHIHHGVQRTHKLRQFFIGFNCAILIGFGTPVLLNILSAKEASSNNLTSQAAAWIHTDIETPKLNVPMPWPEYGYAAYGVPQRDLFATSDDIKQPVRIASLAKVITALTVLKEKPLKTGEQGPALILTEKDTALFNEYLNKNGVVVPVEVGEQISQYQALQAMLLVSANNMSDSLAVWAFGSVDGYVKYANKMLKDTGLDNTVVADASGFSPNTVSTPEDMTKLGYLYMRSPVLREIAMQEEANIPVAGIIRNANSFANENGIVGIKIGNTDEAGRTYMAARVQKVSESKEEISVAVVLGAKSLAAAAQDALAVLKAGSQDKRP